MIPTGVIRNYYSFKFGGGAEPYPGARNKVCCGCTVDGYLSGDNDGPERRTMGSQIIGLRLSHH